VAFAAFLCPERYGKAPRRDRRDHKRGWRYSAAVAETAGQMVVYEPTLCMKHTRSWSDEPEPARLEVGRERVRLRRGGGTKLESDAVAGRVGAGRGSCWAGRPQNCRSDRRPPGTAAAFPIVASILARFLTMPASPRSLARSVSSYRARGWDRSRRRHPERVALAQDRDQAKPAWKLSSARRSNSSRHPKRARPIRHRGTQSSIAR